MKQPNVILFTWHDAGRWFGCYGNRTVDTPNVDRLAAEGVKFNNLHSICAICSPSRAAIMTGTFCQNNGVMTLTNEVFHNRIHPHIPHMAARFKQMGYRTALFGVQHECAHEHLASVLQVDERYATDPWPNADLTATYLRKWLSERVDSDQPFYAQVGTIDSHISRYLSGSPARDDEPYPPVRDSHKGITVPPYLEGSEADEKTIEVLQGLLQRGDRLVGAMLEAMDQAGLAENTLVVMCVDHGVGLPRAKTNCYDPGTEVAWVMRWPGVIPAGTSVDALCSQIDILPTLWDLLELDPPQPCDGVSLAEHLLAGAEHAVHDAVYSFMPDNTRSIRTQTHKLIRNFKPTPWANLKGDCAYSHADYDRKLPEAPEDVTPSKQWPAVELYDLHQDPDELRNLADDPRYEEVFEDLNRRLWDFLLEKDDFLVHAPVRSAWHRATRDALEAHCRRTGRVAPVGEGPLHNEIDAATARGRSAW